MTTKVGLISPLKTGPISGRGIDEGLIKRETTMIIIINEPHYTWAFLGLLLKSAARAEKSLQILSESIMRGSNLSK